MASWYSAKYQKHSAPDSFTNRGRFSVYVLYSLQNLRLQRLDIDRAWDFGQEEQMAAVCCAWVVSRSTSCWASFTTILPMRWALTAAGILGFIARHSLCSIPRTVSRVAQILSAVHKRTLSR